MVSASYVETRDQALPCQHACSSRVLAARAAIRWQYHEKAMSLLSQWLHAMRQLRRTLRALQKRNANPQQGVHDAHASRPQYHFPAQSARFLATPSATCVPSALSPGQSPELISSLQTRIWPPHNGIPSDGHRWQHSKCVPRSARGDAPSREGGALPHTNVRRKHKLELPW
eukprot:scaffold4869_cov33-Tisochrysis_lutea.AAC.2